MNEVKVKFPIAITKFYISVIELLSRCCREHLAETEKALEELKRYGA